MGFKSDKIIYSVSKKEYAGDFQVSEINIHITEEDLNVIMGALFRARWDGKSDIVRHKLLPLYQEKIDAEKQCIKELLNDK